MCQNKCAIKGMKVLLKTESEADRDFYQHKMLCPLRVYSLELIILIQKICVIPEATVTKFKIKC